MTIAENSQANKFFFSLNTLGFGQNTGKCIQFQKGL